MKRVVGAVAVWSMASVLAWSATTAPPALPIGEWIQKLGDERYQQRAEASRQLWEIGEPALPSLREAEKSRDPEVAKRARELVGNIEVGVRPDSDRELLDLIAQFRAGGETQKMSIFGKLRKKSEWRVMLKLYANEKDSAVRMTLLKSMTGVAAQAAREAIFAGKDGEALTLLKMAPRDDDALMAMAVYHRVFGSLKKELAAARDDDPGYKVALLRAAGKVGEAQSLAQKAGMLDLANALAAMDGDPLPWMANMRLMRRSSDIQDAYIKWATARWKGQDRDDGAAEVLARALRDSDEQESRAACGTYYLLGEPALADPMLRKFDAMRAFQYFNSMERTDDALRVIGLDPERPDYAAWFARHLQARDADHLDENSVKVLIMIVFLEQHGLIREIEAHADDMLLEVAQQHPTLFSEWLERLSDRGSASSSVTAMATVRRLARKHAKDDKEKWESIVAGMFQGGRDQGLWWDWLLKNAGDLSAAQRFDLMCDVFHPDEAQGDARAKLLDRMWQSVDRQKLEDDSKELQMLTNLALDANDTATGLRAWDAWKKRPAEKSRQHELRGFLGVAGRWGEAADYALQKVAKDPTDLESNAEAAAYLWRAGRETQAQALEHILEKLAIGTPQVNLRIASVYSAVGEVVRAGVWYDRAVLEISPSQHTWLLAMGQRIDDLIERGEWLRAASASEILCAMQSGRDTMDLTPQLRLQTRVQADFCRALAQSHQNRDAALKLLRQSHQLLVRDGSLADAFFPAIRKAGFAAEQEAMFETSWRELQAMIRRFPACDNNYNTAAWMASRAGHRLDEAEALLKSALKVHPNRAAYLDTMAELCFARDQRKQAVEWSDRALWVSPADAVLWRQNVRFRGLWWKH